jgi:hypothetical protein
MALVGGGIRRLVKAVRPVIEGDHGSRIVERMPLQ